MKFAEIIRSDTQVRATFCDLPMQRRLWQLILRLHGKPIDLDQHSPEATGVLVRGFRFYGSLIRCLAIVMLAAATVAAIVPIANAGFWVSLLLGSACYLALVCQLAFTGAKNWSDQRACAILLTFFIAIIAYLSCFCGVAVAVAHFTAPSYDYVTIPGLLVLLLLGAGSYLLEILFLFHYTAADIELRVEDEATSPRALI